jgi:hypothetical protein
MIEYLPNLLVLQNENANLVASLPYLDEKIDESMKHKVNDIIQQEMLKMPHKDYLANLKVPPLSYFVSTIIDNLNITI